MLALVFSCSLMAAEDSVRADETSLSTPSEVYTYNVNAITVDDGAEEEAIALPEEFRKKVGQPTPGIMLSLLMAGGLAKLLLRLKKRMERKVMQVLARILSAIKVKEYTNALKIFASLDNKYCLKRQMVELRL